MGRIPNLLDHRNFLDDTDPDKRWLWVDRFLGVDEDPFNKKYNEDYFSKTYARHFGTILRTHILGSNVNQQFAAFGPGFEKWLQDKLPWRRVECGAPCVGRNTAADHDSLALAESIRLEKPLLATLPSTSKWIARQADHEGGDDMAV